jgi:hypothetical protein
MSYVGLGIDEVYQGISECHITKSSQEPDREPKNARVCKPLHLALYRAVDLEHAAAKLRQTMLSNLYLLPRLLGLPQDPIDMWYPSNLAAKAYGDGVPHEVLALWEPAALHWARTVYQRAPMQRVRRRYIAIYHQLQTDPPGPKRSRLVNEAFRLHLSFFRINATGLTKLQRHTADLAAEKTRLRAFILRLG